MRQLTAFSVVIATGIASMIPATANAQRRVGEEPPLSTRAQRSVGDVIYQVYNYEQLQGARVVAPILIDVLAAKALIQSGSVLETFHDGAKQGYCTKDLVLSVTMSGRPMEGPMSRVCLADKNQDGVFESWKAPEGPPIRRKWASLKVYAPYSVEDISTAPMQGYRYELLYQGISGSVVSLLYREYVNDLSRPAFQQDLSYTLAPEEATEVSFRGARLRIYSADNNAITYEILVGLQRSAG